MSSTEGVCLAMTKKELPEPDSSVKNGKYVLYLSSECVGGMVNSRIVDRILTILDIIYIVQYLKVNCYLLRIIVLQCS